MKPFFIIKKILLSIFIIILSCFNIILFTSCSNKKDNIIINFYNTSLNKIEKITLHNLICGVITSEISPDVSIEALKTQAIITRTYILNFINNNNSIYQNADISDNINELKSYNKDLINDNIKKAVKETGGIVIKYNNNLINPFYCKNSGGQTALYYEIYNNDNNEYQYLKSVKTFNKNNLTLWTAEFTKNQILNALRNMGQSVANISSFIKGEIGESGRCITFIIGGKEISANTLRENLDVKIFKSTLIESIVISDNNIIITGYGDGNGIGIDQDYSVYLSDNGKNYKEIINYFYKDIDIVLYDYNKEK